MLEAVNLTKSEEATVLLSGLNLSVQPGEVVCLLGGPDSGKNLAIQLFLNLTRPSSGGCKVAGHDVAISPRRTKEFLGYVQARMPLYSNLTGLENVEYLGMLASYEDLDEKAVTDLFTELGLDAALIHRLAGSYTLAERQRAGLALSIARNAQAYLLEEPTLGFSPGEESAFGLLLRRLASGKVTGAPTAVLLSTASADLAAELGDRVYLLAPGGKTAAMLSEANQPRPEILARCQAHMNATVLSPAA